MSPTASRTPEPEDSRLDTVSIPDPRIRLMQRSVSRRAIMAGALGAGVMALLAACGDDDDVPSPTATGAAAATPTTEAEEDAGEEPTESTGGWSFTDDRGVTIELASRPERLVTWSTAGAVLWDYGIRPVGIFGPQRLDNGEQDPQAGEIDLDAVENLGDWDPDLELVVAARPDLIVLLTYDNETIWPFEQDVVDQLAAIAPVAAIMMAEASAYDLIQRWEAFAEALGADLSNPDLVADRELFEQRSDELRAALSEKPDLTTLFLSASPEQFWVASPYYAADLWYFRELGMNILNPGTDVFYEALSWEQSMKYVPDLVFNDYRWSSIEELSAQPSWQAQPAHQAGQVVNWVAVFVMSYRGFAKVLEQVIKDVSAAEVITEQATGGSGAWSFTDGRGETVTLPEMPKRIAAHVTAAAALWDFGIRPTAIFGTQRTASGDPDPGVGRVDLDAVESVGDDRVLVDIEALAAHKPDIVISTMNSDNAMWGMLEPETEERVRQIAPTLGMAAFHESIDGLIENFEELAVALGADLSQDEQANAKAEWEQAVADFEAALEEKPDLLAMVLAPNQEEIFFANPEIFPDLIFYAEHGLEFVDPDVEFTSVWGQVSWERLGMYPVDLVMVDVRRGWPNPAVDSQPTWSQHPAVKADQVAKWNPLVVLSYQGMTSIIQELTNSILAADDSIA